MTRSIAECHDGVGNLQTAVVVGVGCVHAARGASSGEDEVEHEDRVGQGDGGRGSVRVRITAVEAFPLDLADQEPVPGTVPLIEAQGVEQRSDETSSLRSGSRNTVRSVRDVSVVRFEYSR